MRYESRLAPISNDEARRQRGRGAERSRIRASGRTSAQPGSRAIRAGPFYDRRERLFVDERCATDTAKRRPSLAHRPRFLDSLARALLESSRIPEIGTSP